MSIKVLPLEFWMEFEDWCEAYDESWPREARECLPRFNRPGWYFDRVNWKSWFERPSGASYSYPVKQFKEQLEQIEVAEIDRKTIEALKVVIDAKLATKEQRRIYSIWVLNRECWKIGWETRKILSE